MKVSRVLLPVMTGLTALASSQNAGAQTGAVLSAEADSTPAIFDFYGAIELRQTDVRKKYQNTEKTAKSSISVAPSVGAIFWEKRIDTLFYGRYGTSSASSGLETFEAGNETLVDFYKNDVLTMGAYSFTDFDTTTGLWLTTDLGANFSGKYEIPASHGNFAFSGFTRPRGQILSAKGKENNKVMPINGTGKKDFGLDKEEDAEILQRDPAVLIDSEVAFKYSPSVMNKLTVGLALDLNQKWSPQYIAEAPGAEGPSAELDYYRLRQLTLTKSSVSYAVTDTLKVQAELRHYMGGFYGYPINARTAEKEGELTTKSLESRVTVVADLF